RSAGSGHGLDRVTRSIYCSPRAEGFVQAVTNRVRPVLDMAEGSSKRPRVLLTAHGLPKRIVQAGDPYSRQVEATAAAVVAALNRPELDWRICYQSRVGPLEWTGPSTEDEIRRAGVDGVPLVVVPISFVSEHSETLVELDMDYRELAERSGGPGYYRVPTVGIEPPFIRGLALLVGKARAGELVSCPSSHPSHALSGAAG